MKFDDVQPYEMHSNKTPAGQTFLFTLAMIALTGSIGWLLGNHTFEDVRPINYVFVLVGLLVAFAGYILVWVFQIRSRNTASLVAIAAIVVGTLCIHLHRAQFPPIRGDWLRYWNWNVTRGFVLVAFDQPILIRGNGTLIYWFIEFAIACGIGATIPRLAGGRPGCAICGRWKIEATIGLSLTDPIALDQSLQRGDLDVLKSVTWHRVGVDSVTDIEFRRASLEAPALASLDFWFCQVCREQSRVELQIKGSVSEDELAPIGFTGAMISFPGESLTAFK